MITKTRYKGKEKRHAKIVQSYRVNNTSRQKVILNLGPINSDEDEQRFREILESMRSGNDFVKLNEVKARSAKEYGVVYTTNQLLKKYGIERILKKELSNNKAEFDVYEVIKALIINRLVSPSSDLAAYDWILNNYCGPLEVQQCHLYRSLDYLTKSKERIQQDIFLTLKRKLKLNTKTVHYDLTSSYFEGSHCEIALFGYSRDHRRDRRQIVIGLVMCDGIPIFHEVFEGNTLDKTTLTEMVTQLKATLGITRTTFVADRGLITEDNLVTLEDANYSYILGVQRRKNKLAKSQFIKEFISIEDQFAQEIHVETIERKGKTYKRRYILCLNKKTQKERLNTLKHLTQTFEKKLTELQTNYQEAQKPSHRGKRPTREGLMNQAYKTLGKNKRLFNVCFDEGLKFSLNAEKYKYEEQIAGKFLLVTSTDLPANDVMTTYKEQQVVENAFDEIKNFLEIRPIGHYEERRVKAHTFVCVLSFLVECLIERFSSESARKTIGKLQRIRKIDFVSKEHEKQILTEITKETEEIFKSLKIPKPRL